MAISSRKSPFDAATLVRILLVCSLSATASAKTPDPAHRTMAYVHGQSGLGALEKSTLSRGDPFGILCVTGFLIDGDGALRVTVNRDKLTRIRKSPRAQGARIYPLLAPGSVAQGKRLLRSAPSRRAACENVARVVRGFGFDGIHLDFEYFPPEYRDDMAGFIVELRGALPGTIISMAVFPPLGFPKSYAEFHDVSVLGKLLDEIVIMCYDMHRPGTAPGPVTSIDWARSSIERTVTFVPPKRLFLGIPAYGYRWDKNGRASVVTGKQGTRLMRSGAFARDPSGTVRVPGSTDGSVAYFSDAQTRTELTRLSQRHGLAGIAIWRLGFDDL